MCELDNVFHKSYVCEENHQLMSQAAVLKFLFDVYSTLECIYFCMIENSNICAGIDYDKNYKRCTMFTANKFTKYVYVRKMNSVHCEIGYCPSGQGMTLNKTCSPCPINHYKLHRGAACVPCNVGFDTGGIESKECRKVCAAGSYSREGIYCVSKDYVLRNTYRNIFIIPFHSVH